MVVSILRGKWLFQQTSIKNWLFGVPGMNQRTKRRGENEGNGTSRRSFGAVFMHTGFSGFL